MLLNLANKMSSGFSKYDRGKFDKSVYCYAESDVLKTNKTLEWHKGFSKI